MYQPYFMDYVTSIRIHTGGVSWYLHYNLFIYLFFFIYSFILCVSVCVCVGGGGGGLLQWSQIGLILV